MVGNSLSWPRCDKTGVGETAPPPSIHPQCSVLVHQNQGIHFTKLKRNMQVCKVRWDLSCHKIARIAKTLGYCCTSVASVSCRKVRFIFFLRRIFRPSVLCCSVASLTRRSSEKVRQSVFKRRSGSVKMAGAQTYDFTKQR